MKEISKRNESFIGKRFEIQGVGEFEVVPLEKDKPLRCIDGRKPKPGDYYSDNAAKIPGAFWGLVLPASKTLPDLSSRKIIQYANEYEISKNRTPAIHSDTHAKNEFEGCGYLMNALGKSEKAQKKRKEIMNAFNEEINNGMEVNITILDGGHNEIVFIKNKLKNATLKLLDTKKQVFIIDVAANNEELDDFAVFLQKKGIKVNSEELKSNAEELGNNTLSSIAKGKLIYEIDSQDKNIIVTQNGKVPALA